MIGPSGCGKSTLVRCINRMHEEIPGARAEGKVTLDDLDIYGADVDVVSVRRAIGMVFQKPNPFPTMSIFDNVAAGLRLTGQARRHASERVEQSLRGAGPVGRGQGPPRRARHRALRRPAAAAVHRAHDRGRARGDPHGRAVLRARPDRHAADRGADRRSSRSSYTIVIVTHNMQQAARVADKTAFMLNGELVEFGPTEQDLHQPATTRGRRSTSRASSGSGMTGTRPPALPGGAAARSRQQALGALDLVVGDARPHDGGARSTRTSSSPSIVDPRRRPASTAATWRSTRGSCRCSRCRRRWRPTCGSWPRCCT